MPAAAMTSAATTMTSRWASANRTRRSSIPGALLAILEQHRAVDDHAIAERDALSDRRDLAYGRAEADLAPLELARPALSKDGALAVLLDDRAQRQHGLAEPRSGRAEAPEHVRTEPTA